MKSLYQFEIDIRWGDMDAFNHVNNAGYLRFIEEARVQWFRTLTDDWSNVESAPILAAVQNNYRKPIGWPERITVELFCERLGNKSIQIAHRIYSSANSETTYADGHTVLVWMNYHSGQTIPLPNEVRAACE
jgi:acyl-CoA thioester hydrolase